MKKEQLAKPEMPVLQSLIAELQDLEMRRVELKRQIEIEQLRLIAERKEIQLIEAQRAPGERDGMEFSSMIKLDF